MSHGYVSLRVVKSYQCKRPICFHGGYEYVVGNVLEIGYLQKNKTLRTWSSIQDGGLLGYF